MFQAWCNGNDWSFLLSASFWRVFWLSSYGKHVLCSLSVPFCCTMVELVQLWSSAVAEPVLLDISRDENGGKMKIGQKKKARKHKLYLPVIIIGNVKPWFLIYVPLLASAHPSVTGLCVALFNAHSDGTPEKRCEMSTYAEDNAINIMSLLPWGWSKDHRPGAQWPCCQVILVPLLLGWNCCHLQDQPLFQSHSQVWLHFLSQNLWTCSDFYHIAAECFTLLCALITSELQKQTDSMFSEQFQEFLDSCCSLLGQLCISGSIHYDCRLLFSPLTDKPHVSLGDCSAWWRNSSVCGGVWQPWIRPLLCFDCLICQSLILLTCTAWFTAFVALTHWARKMEGASLADAGPRGSDVCAWQWSHSEPLAAILLLIIKLYKSKKLTLAVQNAQQSVL